MTTERRTRSRARLLVARVSRWLRSRRTPDAGTEAPLLRRDPQAAARAHFWAELRAGQREAEKHAKLRP